MTRSVFDPTGDETERGRSQFLGPAPTQHSKMPPAAIDGDPETTDDEPEEDQGPAGADRSDAQRDIT
jgi:hypothetical protein